MFPKCYLKTRMWCSSISIYYQITCLRRLLPRPHYHKKHPHRIHQACPKISKSHPHLQLKRLRRNWSTVMSRRARLQMRILTVLKRRRERRQPPIVSRKCPICSGKSSWTHSSRCSLWIVQPSQARRPIKWRARSNSSLSEAAPP